LDFINHRLGAFGLRFSTMLAEVSLLVALSVQQGSGAEACMGAGQLKRGVEKRLKRRVFVEPAQASLKLVVIFTRSGSDTEARIELSNIDGAPRGTRSLVTSSHCSALDDSLALSVALLVDQPPEPEPPTAVGLAPTPATPPTGPPSPPAAPRRAATPLTIPADVAAPREPWHARFGASGVAAWGVLPAVRPALAFYLKLVPRNFLPISVQGEGFWPATAARDDSSGARFHLFRVGVAVCPALHERPEIAVSLCVGQKVGWLTVDGYGFDHDQQERRLSYALSAGGEARLRLFAPVSLRGYLGTEVPLARDRFTSGGRSATKLFEPSPIAIWGEIGLEAALW
jgi:hypothetical protein